MTDLRMIFRLYCTPLAFVFLFSLVSHLNSYTQSKDDIAGITVIRPRLEIIATDGLKMFQFEKSADGVYVQKSRDTVGGPNFDAQLQETPISAWFYPYTVQSGAAVTPRFTKETEARASEALGDDFSLLRIFKIDDDFSGRLEISGRVAGDDERGQNFSIALFVHPPYAQSAANIFVIYPT